MAHTIRSRSVVAVWLVLAGVAARADEAEGGRFVQRNLVSDGSVEAEHVDPHLVNAWGIARLPASPWWVADNETGVSTLYDGEGNPQQLVVSIPGASGSAAPTGLVANPGAGFVITLDGVTAPARFLFASEDGTISAWTRSATVVPTHSLVVAGHAGAIYKGLTIAASPAGERLYATNFHDATVEVFDDAFHPITVPGGFADPAIPDGFAPFGIRALGGRVYVTYAMQDADAEDDVAGAHLGYVDAFTPDGVLEERVASAGKLNAPWGLALAPDGFGRFGGRLLVGNFGDGRIVAFRVDGHDASEGGGAYLTGAGGRITIDGLWGIDFGNGGAAGPATTLFFAAGPDDESHGLFGRIDFVHGDE